jgi:hypothetical protein
MTDYIRLPRSALTDEFWRNKNFGCLLWYLLSKTDERGVATFTAAEIEMRLGISRQRLRTMLGKIQKSRLATSIQPTSNQQATNIVFDFQRIVSIEQPTSNQHSTNKQPTKTVRKTVQSQDGFERFRDYFNNAVVETSIPQITKLTDARKNALRSIFKEYGKETVEAVIRKVIASDFLAKEWGKVSFDWIFKKSNFIKILEGNYDNRTKPITTTDNAASRAESRERLRTLATGVVSQSTDKLFDLYNGSGTNSDVG